MGNGALASGPKLPRPSSTLPHVLGAQAGPRQLEEVLAAAGLGTVRPAAETPFNLIIEARR